MFTLKSISDGTVTLETECINCHRRKDLEVDEIGWKLWTASPGALIQNSMPDVSADDRELLITGICGICFDELWAQKLTIVKMMLLSKEVELEGRRG